jgi:hypothetical protein
VWCCSAVGGCSVADCCSSVQAVEGSSWWGRCGTGCRMHADAGVVTAATRARARACAANHSALQIIPMLPPNVKPYSNRTSPERITVTATIHRRHETRTRLLNPATWPWITRRRRRRRRRRSPGPLGCPALPPPRRVCLSCALPAATLNCALPPRPLNCAQSPRCPHSAPQRQRQRQRQRHPHPHTHPRPPSPAGPRESPSCPLPMPPPPPPPRP